MKKLFLLLLVLPYFISCNDSEEESHPLVGHWGQTINIHSSVYFQFIFSKDSHLTIMEIDVVKKEKKEILSTTYELTAKNSYNFLIAGNDEWIYTLSDGNKLTIYGFNNITYITLEKNYDPQAEYDKQKE